VITNRRSAAASTSYEFQATWDTRTGRLKKLERFVKARAITQIATELLSALNMDVVKGMTLVPMPPSKNKADPLYDDRMLQVLQHLGGGTKLDVRELLMHKASTDDAHTSGSRPRPADLEANLKLDKKLLAPAPKHIAIFDDVLTTGSHFVAARAMLKAQFPAADVTGIFVSRTIRPLDAAADLADFVPKLDRPVPGRDVRVASRGSRGRASHTLKFWCVRE